MGFPKAPNGDRDHQIKVSRTGEGVGIRVSAPRPRRSGTSMSFSQAILVNILFMMMFLAVAAYAFGPLHESRPVAAESRGLDASPARLSPRSFSNDTVGVYFNTTVVINDTAVVTHTETVGVQQTLTSLETITETVGTEETITVSEEAIIVSEEAITVSAVASAEGASAVTITDVQTVVVTTQIVETVDGAEETYTINSTRFVTHTETVRSGVVSTVTHYVEPYPASESTGVASQELESDSDSVVDNTGTQTLISTLTITNTEHFDHKSSESASQTGPDDRAEEFSATTTLTVTPTVTITDTTLTMTPLPTTVDAASTPDHISTNETENTIFVTKTVEPVCGTEEAHYTTVTETVYREKETSTSSEPESTSSGALGQPGDPVMASSISSSLVPESLTTTATHTSTSVSARTTLLLTITVTKDETIATNTHTSTSVSAWTTISLTETVTRGKTITTVLADEPSVASVSQETPSFETSFSTEVKKITQVVTKTHTHTHTEIESPDAATVTSWRTVIDSSEVLVPATTTITQSVDVDLDEKLSTSTITEVETPTGNVEHGVSTITSIVESTETQYYRTSVTDVVTEVVTEIITRKIFTTGASAEVRETVVTDTILHTDLVTVTHTRSAEVTTAPVNSTVWVTAAHSTVSSVLGNVGNGTYNAPNATATHVQVAGGKKVAHSIQGGAAFSMVMAIIGLLVLF